MEKQTIEEIKKESATIEDVIKLVAILEMEINEQLIEIRKRLDKLENAK